MLTLAWTLTLTTLALAVAYLLTWTGTLGAYRPPWYDHAWRTLLTTATLTTLATWVAVALT